MEVEAEMREIKFQGKRVDNEEWVYGDLLQNEQGSFIVEEFEACNPYGDDGDSLFGMVWHQVIPETVGQYTGLKDKNGKEIYEGDVVKAEHDNYYNPEHEEEPEYSAWIGSIEYKEGYYQINTNCEYRPAINNIRIKTIEIIGNVHDNPNIMNWEVMNQ